MEVVGENQGQYPPEATREVHKNKNRSPVLRVDYSMFRARDIQRHTFSNEPVQRPIKVLKEWGGITPLINQAVVTNEPLKTVTFTFVRPKGKGKFEEYLEIKLEDARAISQTMFTGSPDDGSENTSKTSVAVDTLELEEIEYSFRKITITNLVDGQATNYDWNKPNVK